MAEPLTGRRRLIGIAGPPGAGKTTIATSYVRSQRQAGVAASYLPMDGFHLADVTLDALGLRDRKGAPETFDAWGYAALLARLRLGEPHPVYAPGFERDLEQPIAAAVVVPPDATLVVTEGNYLLLDRPEWRAVRALLDEIWYVDVDPVVRHRRLVERHVRFGKSVAEAEAWVSSVDEPNARLIEASREVADRVVTAQDGLA